MSSISIVFLTYNNYEKFFRCMTSMFFFLTERRIKEIIILDNGSYQVELKDYLKSLEKQIDKVRVIFSNENLGIGKGRKLLFDVATGDYIISMDSDIVILNPPSFLEVFYRALDIENMMLVGGGGGDHPFFPSMERESIDNKDSPENPNELKVVDEVAGWFTGFKSSILKKNGGKVEMDEQFSPFWAEDSDFCVQIKLLGGKCCIMGKGLVAHQWSSCSKKETQTTLEAMWNKFQDKWYPKFGKELKFNMDEDFYEANYEDSKNLLRRKEFYLKVGILRGDIYSKDVILKLYKDVNFKSLTKLTYPDVYINSDGDITQEEKEWEVKEFSKKFITKEAITKKHFKIIKTNLEDSFEDLIVLVSYNEIEAVEILKRLAGLQKINVCVCIANNSGYYSIVDFLERSDNKHMICSFNLYELDLIPFSICYMELRKKFKFNRVLNLSTKRNQKFFLSKPLSEIEPGGILEEDVEKIDKFNLSLIGNNIALFNTMMWNKESVYLEKTSYYDIFFNSIPFKEIFDKCLKITQPYSNFVTPRCSPYHSLERIFGYMKQKINNKKTLCIIEGKISNEEDLELVKNNLKYFKNSDIVFFNKGSMKHIKVRELGCDFHYPINEDSEPYDVWQNGLGLTGELENYNNIIFTNTNYKIESNIEEFLERARYKNISHLRRENGFDLDLFSIVVENINPFMGNCQKIKEENLKRKEVRENLEKTSEYEKLDEAKKEALKELDFYKEVSTGLLSSLNCTSVWKSEKTETEDEIVYEYKKEGTDNGEDYPFS